MKRRPQPRPERLRPVWRGLGLCLLGAVCTTAVWVQSVWADTSAAEEVSAENDRVFQEAIDVFEVSVSARVLKNGAPVRGLTADDFVLLDRGREQTLTGFSIIERDLPQPIEEGPADDAPLASARNLLLLFDAQRLVGNDPRRAVEGARTLLSRPIPPGDRWGIAVHGVTVSGDRNMSARLLVGFTDDRTRLGLGLDAVAALFDRRPRQASALLRQLAGGRDTFALQREGRADEVYGGIDPAAALTLFATKAKRGRRAQRQDAGRSSGLSGGLPLGWLGVDAPEGLVRDTDDTWFGKSSRMKVSDGSPESRLRWFALAMADLATFLRDLSGDNQLLLLSSGGYGRMSDSFTTGRMVPMLAAFRRAGWTFQAIDVRGRGFRADDMFYMANETGGTLVENVADIGQAIVRARSTSDVTYRLSFRPDKVEVDGRYHRIKVRLRDKSLGDRVTHRKGYFAPAPRDERTDLDLRLDQMRAVLGSVEREDVDVDVRIESVPTATLTTRATVPIAVGVDGRSLLANHRQPAVTIKIEGYALSDAGAVLDLFVDEATIDLIAAGTLAGNRLQLRRQLSLPPGQHRLRVWVENVETGAITLRTIPIEVPLAP